MANEAGNVELLKKAYQRWHDTKGGSSDEWIALCADNVAFGSIAQGAVSGAHYLTSYQDRSALSEYFAGIARDWEMIEYVAEHYVSQGDRVVMLGRCSYRNRKTGKVVATPKADSWRFANGRAIEFYEYFDTAQVQAASA